MFKAQLWVRGEPHHVSHPNKQRHYPLQLSPDAEQPVEPISVPPKTLDTTPPAVEPATAPSVEVKPFITEAYVTNPVAAAYHRSGSHATSEPTTCLTSQDWLLRTSSLDRAVSSKTAPDAAVAVASFVNNGEFFDLADVPVSSLSRDTPRSTLVTSTHFRLRPDRRE